MTINGANFAIIIDLRSTWLWKWSISYQLGPKSDHQWLLIETFKYLAACGGLPIAYEYKRLERICVLSAVWLWQLRSHWITWEDRANISNWLSMNSWIGYGSLINALSRFKASVVQSLYLAYYMCWID